MLPRGPGGLRSRVRASAPRVGGGGHDAPTRDPGRRRERPLRLDRRRRSSHVYDPCRQRGRGASARRGARSSRRGLLRHRRRAGRLSSVRLRADLHPGLQPPGRSLPDWAARGVAAASELAWRRLPLKKASRCSPALPTGCPPTSARSTSRRPGASSATSRDGRSRRARRDARTGLGRRRSARANARGPAQARRGARLEGRDRVGAR